MSYQIVDAADIKSLFKPEAKQAQVFDVLADMEWHCRTCDFVHIQMRQIAGGGGIQGLERGTKGRPGLELITKDQLCGTCNDRTKHDRWTGKARQNQVFGDLPKALKERVAKLYGYRDPFTGGTLRPSDCIVDHRFPRERWGPDYECPMDKNATDDALKKHYQLLRNTRDSNDNLRKSRSCESCIAESRRKGPLNHVEYFYRGDAPWPEGVPLEGKLAFEGCEGCGWFNVEEWLKRLGKLAAQ